MEGALSNEHEEEANEFARDWLIPPQYSRNLAAMPKSEVAISALAGQLGIAPGIIVGQLQNEGLLKWNSLLNKFLKVRYEWRHEA